MSMNTATFWALTINNPDENDYAIIRQGYPDYVRSLIHTTEVGQDGTPHIQGWMKLQRQQRLSFVKKLFPRAHFTPLTQAEHELNTRRYVQKEDETTAGAHTQTHNTPIPDAVTVLEKYCEQWIHHCEGEVENITDGTDHKNSLFDRWVWQMTNDGVRDGLLSFIKHAEKDDVIAKPQVAKLLVSPMYGKIKKEFLKEILTHMVNKDADDNESEQQDAGGEVGEEYQSAEIQEAEADDSGSESDDDTEGSGETTDSGER